MKSSVSQVLIKEMVTTMNKQLALGCVLLLSAGVFPVWADSGAMQGGQVAKGMPMENMDHSAMPGMNHDDKQNADKRPGMTQARAQGGSAPADARDPHAYSGGYSIESGKYALPGPRILKLADEYNFASLLMDRLEMVRTSDNSLVTYDLQAWYGRDYDRLVIKAEGNVDNGKVEEASTELLWGHALATYWDGQLGLRYDSGEDPSRTWVAFGVQGLAPYWFELDITGYVGEEGRTALGLEAEYEILFTQKLILTPRIEASAYGKDDTERGIGSGLSELSAGLRLRYEIRREFAPYVGVEWAGTYGDTADYARAAGLDARETRAVAGLRFWF